MIPSPANINLGAIPASEAALLADISFVLNIKCSSISFPILAKYFLSPSVTKKF